MRWRLLVFQSLNTVILLILDKPSQFDLPRLMASDAIREEGTSGLWTDFGSAMRAVAPQSVQVMGASDTTQRTPKSSGMGPTSPLPIHCPPSEYAEVRVLRVARRAIRQFYRENVILQRPDHHFRSSAGRDLRSASGGQS